MGFLAPAALLAVLFSVAAQKPSIQFSNPPPSDWIHIDGSKNPELIPEWSVWDAAFRMFLQVGDLPTVVLQVLSAQEAATIQEAARAHGKITTECEKRGLKLLPLLETETAKVINEKTQALNLDCRRQTLSLRDRSLESLRPDAQMALSQWVEALKKGMRASVPKRELDFYLQPR